MTTITETIAELRRLRAAGKINVALCCNAVGPLLDEIERLTAERDCHSHNHDVALDQRDALRAKLDRLVAAAQKIRDYEDGTNGGMTDGSFLSVPTGLTNHLRAAIADAEAP